MKDYPNMEKTQHTPGPWHYGAKLDVRREIPGVSYPVAQCRVHDFVNDKAALANARLIAAAPELLAFAKLALDRLDLNNGEGEEDKFIKQGQAIVAKAAGG